jgi:hypothetical protein
MNYRRIYKQIINRAKGRELGGYKEKHHIKPKCLGGSDSKRNLVELTAKEHLICHKLLVEIYPTNEKLLQSLWLMSIGKRSKVHKIRSGREYERLKINFSNLMKTKKTNLGSKYSDETRLKMSLDRKGKKRSQKTKDKMRDSALGKIRTEQHKNNLSKSITKAKGRIIIQSDLNGNLIREWITGKKASIELNLNYISINNCCRRNAQNQERLRDKNKIGKHTALGYIWEYKN